ncbi:MAG TPA: arylsulfatase [Bacteroidales bacterium]|jgi:arylsulfatase A-like enzyme|nr:arylsulfatase [Bacteroidales bacterium]HQJ83079.1 arylsulfatase [Bacteroidales bacterium]
MKKNYSRNQLITGALGIAALSSAFSGCSRQADYPNIVIIYADDLGYGDISCYGATSLSTPNIDRVAENGLLFTNAHSTSATSTPSRYSLLTGEYAWRREGTGIATGDAPAIITPGRTTIASVLKNAGYVTGVVGKWHLGMGPEGGADWNGEITSGPLDIGFDYNYVMPATGDRVPTVFVENRRVVNLDPEDPIRVSFREPILVEPTGRDHPELLKMHPSHGHDMTIVNGISRIGYMSGGRSAWWTDEDIADVITGKAVDFIKQNKDNRFFLYFATNDIHVPRVPHPRFAGRSTMGPRGDVILELDWTVGEIVKTLDELNLSRNTILIVTSDNGPVVDDGYRDDAVEKLGDHKPAGPLRGGKYSAFDGGTRIPFIIYWPEKIRPGTTDALFSQIDLMASFASLTGQELSSGTGPDSFNSLAALTGKTKKGREWLVEHSLNGRLSLIKDDWKYIEPGPGPKIASYTNIELGNDTIPQLYNLKADIGEKVNVAADNESKVKELSTLLSSIKEGTIKSK